MIQSDKVIGINKAVQILSDEGICAIPTETVYGLAADATNSNAVAKIYALKNRPTFNPLIVHVSSIKQATAFAEISSENHKVCSYFWDQNLSLTVVLPLKATHLISPLVTAGLNTIAVRRPNHPIALDIINRVGPIAAPSANQSMHISPTSADHVCKSFGKNSPYIVDGGLCTVGLESTILDLSNKIPCILRAGGVTKEDLETYFKMSLNSASKTIKAPGMMKKHYAPACPVILNAQTMQPGDVLLGFGPKTPKGSTLNLSPTGNLTEAATNLFDALYKLEAMKPKRILISPIPMIGLGIAINDRISRAAAA
ncbi:MAG: threonylcarbamoyl-AMP synthase [Alphaproteobacteria bacterium CG_4_10_14_0_8_um_filter_37_21]|nr:MAG: threonylcarbamoyl-AMP synthase [Alphaproteobacteria bacterium CG_4_10_14_0_8_um_filter_37_21]